MCVRYAGISINDFNTSTEPMRLLNTGAFVEMVGEKYTDSPDYLREGDILVTRTKGHTCVVLNDGDKAEPIPPEPVDKYVLVVGGSVNVRTADSTKGRILFTAHKGDKFPYIDTAETGWYHVRSKKGEGYITNLERYTKLEG